MNEDKVFFGITLYVEDMGNIVTGSGMREKPNAAEH